MSDIKNIYLEIRRQIIEHEVKPGQKLNQRKLAEAFGTSSTPVIKALHRLSSEGLVDNIPNRGFIVHSSNVKELEDLYELREALEVTAVADLTELDPEEINRIADELQSLLDNMDLDDQVQYRKMDVAFHNLIINSSSNEMLKSINETHQILNRTYLPGLLRDPKTTITEHEKIIDALRTRDKETLMQTMRTHISVTKTSISKLVKRLQWVGLNPRNILVNDLEGKSLSDES